jgi:hypothetical protein
VFPVKVHFTFPRTIGIPGLLRHDGCTWSFRVPRRGRLVVAWYRGGKLIAIGPDRFTKAGMVKVGIRLTAAGRRLLRTFLQTHRSLRLTAKATYTPARGSAVSVTRVLRLR